MGEERWNRTERLVFKIPPKRNLPQIHQIQKETMRLWQVEEVESKVAASLLAASRGASFDQGPLKFQSECHLRAKQDTENVEQRAKMGEVGMNGAWPNPGP